MVQNKVGRPRKFDRETALSAAVEVFWTKGYDGSSLGDLTNAMGINRPSLYSTYGDKHTLYLAALAFYGSSVGCAPLAAFEAEASPEKAVRAFFETLLENQTRPGNLAQGCLLASCAATTAGEVQGVTEMLAAGTTATVEKLTNGFENFIGKNQLPPKFPSKVKARLLLDIMQGYAYRARTGEPRQNLFAEIDQKVEQVIAIGEVDVGK